MSALNSATSIPGGGFSFVKLAVFRKIFVFGLEVFVLNFIKHQKKFFLFVQTNEIKKKKKKNIYFYFLFFKKFAL